MMASAHAAEHAEESRVLIRVFIVKSSTSADVGALGSRALQDSGGPLPVSGGLHILIQSALRWQTADRPKG